MTRARCEQCGTEGEPKVHHTSAMWRNGLDGSIECRCGSHDVTRIDDDEPVACECGEDAMALVWSNETEDVFVASHLDDCPRYAGSTDDMPRRAVVDSAQKV